MYSVVRKLKMLKNKLGHLHKQHFQSIIKQVNDDRTTLQKVQTQLKARPLDRIVQQEEKRVRQQFQKSSYLAESMLQQRRKANWIRLGDDNTRYFFSLLKMRKLMQSITQLRDQNGHMQHSLIQISKIFVEYYQNLLVLGEELREKKVGKLLSRSLD